jgi:hypothetical protein
MRMAGLLERVVSKRSHWLLAGLVVLALMAHFGVVSIYAPGARLSLGSLTFPMPDSMAVFASWLFFGTLAAIMLGAALAIVAGERSREERFEREWRQGSDRAWILAGTAFALAAAVAVRFGVLHGAAVADDEASYEFAARLLASGRLSIPSPPWKLFLDHAFLINDGRLRSVYFLGWPALMAPGVWLGIPGLMNSAYFASSVPALYLVARDLWGSVWARAILVFWLSSPFLLVLAATELSHASCIAALAWAVRLLFMTRAEKSGWMRHALFAGALSLAFFIRPMSGLGLGAPLAVVWARDRWVDRGTRWRAVAAFGAVALVSSLLFLWIQNRQFGSPWKTGYERSAEYHEENRYRFSPFFPGFFSHSNVTNFGHPATALTTSISGWFRLFIDLGGWPLLLAFGLLVAVFARGIGVFWGMFAGGVASVSFLYDPGIDTFGPVHFAELSIPISFLFLAGVRHASLTMNKRGEGASTGPGVAIVRRLPVAFCFAAVVVAWIGYVPVRWSTLEQVCENIRLPELAVERANVGRAVIFSSFPWIWPPCVSIPARHFRFLRPVNDPDFSNRIVWVNHVTLDEDRKLMTEFPDRQGFAISWSQTCEPRVVPLQEATEDLLPPARQRRWW